MALGGGTWAVPTDDAIEGALEKVRGLIVRGGGDLLVFDAVPRGPESGQRFASLYTDGIEAQWQEFLADCGKYRVELEHETSIKKFTLAELEEEEHSLERLQRWHERIAARDLYGAASAGVAARRLKECTKHLEVYARRVYRAVGQ